MLAWLSQLIKRRREKRKKKKKKKGLRLWEEAER